MILTNLFLFQDHCPKLLKFETLKQVSLSQVDRVVPLLASESSTTNIEVQEVKGTEI